MNTKGSGSPDALDRRAVVSGFYEAFGKNDVSRLDTIVENDWQDVPLAPGQGPGRDGLRALVTDFHRAFSDVNVTVERVIVEGDDVASRVAIDAVHCGTFLGVPPSALKAC